MSSDRTTNGNDHAFGKMPGELTTTSNVVSDSRTEMIHNNSGIDGASEASVKNPNDDCYPNIPNLNQCDRTVSINNDSKTNTEDNNITHANSIFSFTDGKDNLLIDRNSESINTTSLLEKTININKKPSIDIKYTNIVDSNQIEVTNLTDSESKPFSNFEDGDAGSKCTEFYYKTSNNDKSYDEFNSEINKDNKIITLNLRASPHLDVDFSEVTTENIAVTTMIKSNDLTSSNMQDSVEPDVRIFPNIGTVLNLNNGSDNCVDSSKTLKETASKTDETMNNLIKPVANVGIVTRQSIQENMSKDVADSIEFGIAQSESQRLIHNDDSISVSSFEGNSKADLSTSVDMCKLQIESLEQLLSDQRKEVASLQDRLRQQSERLTEGDKRGRDIEARMDTMRKQLEYAVREKDATVMRYAVSEKYVIEARSARDLATKAEKSSRAEAEMLSARLRSAHADKARICRMLDEKVHELAQSQKDSLQAKKDLQTSETKLKWTQNKLRNEMDAYRDATSQSEKLQQHLTALQAEKEQFQINLHDSSKAKELEIQLKEVQAMLILERHERETAESKCKQVAGASETTKSELHSAHEEVHRLKARVEQLLIENAELEARASEVTALKTRAAQCDTLTVQLQRERDRTALLEGEAAELRSSASRALEKAAEATGRQSEALRHLQVVTDDNVRARTRCGDLEGKLSELLPKYTAMSSDLEAARRQLSLTASRLDDETAGRRRDSELLARRVAELTKENEEIRAQLDWHTAENGLLKKKNANAVKELTRELQRTLKRCENLEAKVPQPAANQTDSVSARTGSTSSLSSFEGAAAGTPSGGNGKDGSVDVNDRLSEDGAHSQEGQAREPTKQQLIERIVSLQRALARRADRADFLEEHSRQLTQELRAKSRVVRSLALKCPAGAVADTHSDQNKAEFVRRGAGVMAAVYGADPDVDSGMTMSLSLEMNRKLQAVLEDALLKNMTLEENIETLGNEIARLLAAKRTS